MSREDILKKNGIKTQTPNTVQNISNDSRSEILRKNGITISPTQMSATTKQNAFNILNNATSSQNYDSLVQTKENTNNSAVTLKGPMQALDAIKGGNKFERTLAERQNKRNAGLMVEEAPLFTPIGLAEAGSNPIELVEAHRQAEKELSNINQAQKEAGNYEKYMGNEYSKLGEHQNKLADSIRGTDINQMARDMVALKNAEAGKEVQDLSKYYDSGAIQANYILGNLNIRYNEAMAKYLKTQNLSDLNEAERIKELITLYNENAQNVGKGGLIRKDFASYAPQLVGQTVSGVKGALAGAGAGTLTGAGIGSVVPGAGTAAGASTGALWGARGGYVAGVGAFSYDQMIGSAYSQLLDLGIPDNVAREVASDTALWQSVVEMTGAVVDLASLGLGSKAVKSVAGKTAGQLTAKQLIKNALKAYGINLVEETAEESIQEKIAIEEEKKAFEKAGLERTTTDEEDWQRIVEAGAGGFKIALVSGSGNVIGNITATSINSSTISKVNKTYDEQINKIKTSNLSEQQKQEQINILEEGRKKTVNAIKDAMTETEGNKIINVKNLQENVTPQSSNTQIQQQTNEVTPQQTENQQNANVAQNNTQIEQNIPNNEQISQNNVQNAQDLQKTGQNDTERFSQQVEQWKNNKWNPKEDLVVLEKTPQLYLDMGLKDFPITITTSKLESVYNKSGKQRANYHNLKELVKQLPEAIQRPLNIVESVTRDDSIVIITDLTDYKGDIVVVSLALDNEGKISINNVLKKKNVNRMTSAYGRVNYDYNINENGEYEDGWMELNKKNNRIIYDIDDGIMKKRVDGKWLQLPSNINSSNVSSTTNIPINNIIQSNENYVNTQENIMPSVEQLQARDSKQGEEISNTLNMKRTKSEGKTNKSKPNFILVNEKDSYKRNMFNNNAKAINDLIKAKSEITNELAQKIKDKKQLYNNKKDKTTKTAQNLKNQIINLEKRKADIEEKLIKKINRLETQNANINKLKKQVSEDRLPTRKEIKQDIITQTDMDSINLDNVKDISKWTMNNTIPLRVNEKIFDRETANKINDTFFRPIKHNEAERIRFLNKERAEIEALGIKPRSEESEYVQIYGEGEWVNPSTGEVIPYTLKDLQKKFPKSWKKIKQAAETIREKYDTYLDAVNKELNKMGYDSIPKLKNYFRHFEETTSLLDQIGIPSKADALPTDMNGLTSDLKPGKNFFANALSRTGKKTTYDAITGIDGYLEGVSKLMYHTEDIQKLRTFDEYIRGKYGKNSELEGLNKADFQKRVEQIQEGHLSEYASWLTEYTNTLAGKKSRMDRGMEEALGRRIYGTLNVIKKQVGSNLTGLNLNSALSNFISVTQGASKTSKLAMLEGFGDTVKNIFVKDNFINESDFLTRRFGSDKLSKTMWENISNAGQIFMAGTDYLSANIITRSKYYEYLNKGYPKNEAVKLADEFADRIMGGRALGDMPNIFNSKTLGILTQFQLENVNQFDAMFHDTKYENRAEEQTRYQSKTFNEKIKSNLAKKDAKLYNGLTATFVLGQLFAYAWAYNKLDEELTGSGGAFDPIGILEDLIKDFMNKDLSKADALKNFAKNVIDVIPYANTLTGGGRVPMTDAIPNISDLLEGESSIGSEAWKLFNLALPTGGGQIRKTIQGATALIQGGDYKTNSEGEKQLKFPIAQDGSIGQKILEGAQALLFGKWATPGGKQYIESGFKPLSALQTEGLEKAKDLDVSVKEFYDIMQKIKAIEVPTRKNKEGKDEAIPGARKKLIIEELNKTDLNSEQKKLFYDIFYSQELK